MNSSLARITSQRATADEGSPIALANLTNQSDGTSQNLLRLVTRHQVLLHNAVQDPVVLLESLISDRVVSCQSVQQNTRCDSPSASRALGVQSRVPALKGAKMGAFTCLYKHLRHLIKRQHVCALCA